MSLLGMGAGYLLAFAFNKLFKRLRWKPRPLLIVNILLWATLAFAQGGGLGLRVWEWPTPAFIRPECLIAGGLLWGLGWRFAYTPMRFTTLIGEFQFGLVILLVASFLDAQWAAKSTALVPATLIFFASALSGISISHARERNSWLSGLSLGRWIGFLGCCVGMILLTGLLIGVAVNPALLRILLSLLAKGGQLLLWILKEIFEFLNSLIPPPKPVELPGPSGMGQIRGPSEAPILFMPDWLRRIFRIIWGVGGLILVLIALWQLSSQVFHWLRKKLGRAGDEEVEFLTGAFREDLSNWLKRIFRALRVRWPFKEKRRVVPGLVGAEAVRRIYRHLLTWAAESGCIRQAWQTPHEFLQNLNDLLPEGRFEFTFITQLYVQARYSLFIPGEDGLRQLQQSWERIRKMRSSPKRKEPPSE